MAIYSCNIRSIGRTTHAEGTAGAHLRYIGRERAASEVMASHMPEDPQEARTWMDQHEREARKNARLCDKIRLALPRELDEGQRAQLVRDYMHDLTQDRVPWYAAIHQTGKDAHNPHAHIAAVDKDIETGKRVMRLSDSTRDRQKNSLPGPSAVEWVRERWEHHANAALERAGHDARIDRRSLEALGIEREPQIHVGPRAQHIDTHVKRPDSKVVPSPSPRNPDRMIDYPMIDAGRTRRERNAEIIDLNLERAARSKHFETRVWAQFERDQRAKDRPLDAQIMAATRQRTLEERRMRRSFAEIEQDIRARRNAESRLMLAWLREKHAPHLDTLKSSHKDEFDQVSRRHGSLWIRFVAAVDFTGRTRDRLAQEVRETEDRQRRDRNDLAKRIQNERAAHDQAIRSRYKSELDDVAAARAREIANFKAQHRVAQERGDARLQDRAREREQAHLAVQKQIDDWKKRRQRNLSGEQHIRPGPIRSKKSEVSKEWQDKAQASSTSQAEDHAAQERREYWQRRYRARHARDHGYEQD